MSNLPHCRKCGWEMSVVEYMDHLSMFVMGDKIPLCNDCLKKFKEWLDQ